MGLTNPNYPAAVKWLEDVANHGPNTGVIRDGVLANYARLLLQHLIAAEPPGRLPVGALVTLLLPGFPTMPREGWTIENIDAPSPLKYRIRHPNGSLLDVLPECVAERTNEQ